MLQNIKKQLYYIILYSKIGGRKLKKTNYEGKKHAIRRYLEKKASLNIWLEPEEKEYIRHQAKKEGVAMSEYVKKRILSNKNT